MGDLGHLAQIPLHKQMQERGTTNHLTVNYLSGVIPALMRPIVGNTDAKGRATCRNIKRRNILTGDFDVAFLSAALPLLDWLRRAGAR